MFKSSEPPSLLTSEKVRSDPRHMGIDDGVLELVCALLDTGVLYTTYSCEGHFNFKDNPHAFCHHNQKAQVSFRPKDVAQTTALCMEILETVVVKGIDLGVKIDQNAGESEAGFYLSISWRLEFRPQGFWATTPQDGGMLIQVAKGWTEEKARKLLDKAFKATIRVCQKGKWRG